MKKLPGSRNCFVCGRENPCSLKMAFYLDEAGDVVATTTIPDQYQGYPGMAHGGVITAILDETSGRAATAEDPDRVLVTSDLTVRFRLPVPLSQPLRVVGRLVKRRGEAVKAMGEIFDEAGNLLAESTGVFIDITDRVTEEQNPEITGWRVYPDED